MSGAVQLRQLGAGAEAAGEAARWDEFVLGCGQATFFHRAGWKSVLERAFGHRTYFLYAEAEGRIEGVLPLAEIDSLLFGHSLASLPFCVYGGIAATSERARRALDDAARAIAQERRVDHLELRCIEPQHPEWAQKNLYVTFRKPIEADPERCLTAIPRKQRAMVRKGIAAGLKSELDEDVGRFFDAYAASVHRLGTPVFARRYFQILREVFGRDCEVLTVTRQGRTVAAVLSFYFRDEVLPYYGGGTLEARECAANDFMYWELMRRGCERGIRIFDYGRSKLGSGSFDFKKNWGFAPQPLHYEYLLVRGKRIPDLNPMSRKFSLAVALWRRMPQSLANAIGPHIVRNLG